MNKFVVLTDVHANLTALRAVIDHFSSHYQPDGIAFLGDLVDYGIRPNEVIKTIESLDIPVICTLAGNHEKAILDNRDLAHFSSDRGRHSLNYTKSILNPNSLSYLQNKMNQFGKVELTLNEKKILFIHGDLDNPHWGKLTVDKVNDARYSNYDYVISGHTHIPHFIEVFFPDNNPILRNQKKSVFLNPGSVGQPRNHNPEAQYMYVDLKSQVVHHNSVFYDIENERKLYPDFIDPFYKDRLLTGI